MTHLLGLLSSTVMAYREPRKKKRGKTQFLYFIDICATKTRLEKVQRRATRKRKAETHMKRIFTNMTG